MTRSGKYGPLFDWFVALPATTNEVRLTFGKIEEIIGGALPQSAHDYDAWWTDASAGTTHVHALAGLENGWRVKAVKWSLVNVTFHRVGLEVDHVRRYQQVARDRTLVKNKVCLNTQA